MKRYYYLLLLLSLHTGLFLYAQGEWTKQDSIQLQRVLSGEETFQLNDAAKKAIESGTLLFSDPYGNDQMKMKSAEWPVMKSFEGITAPESGRKLKPAELPPSVFKLYGMDQKDSLPDATRSTVFYSKTVEELIMLEKLTPRKATVDDKTTLRTGRGFDAENILRSIFWSSHRAKKRNRKNATAAKTYNNGY
ncbi:MAG: DUF4858 domain-containing protein [Tannerella sp.]|jgi:hypothetical protein|nr:DUF4858 domain-containing protein [Tannerella sp.]